MPRRNRYRIIDRNPNVGVINQYLHQEIGDYCGYDVPVLSNLVIGQHTGMEYFPATHEYGVRTRCLRCKARARVRIPEQVAKIAPTLDNGDFTMIKDVMNLQGCHHEQAWLMTPTLVKIEDESVEFWIVYCTSCEMRSEIGR